MAKNPNYFVHTVIFWMNEPENQAQRSELETGLKKLLATSEFVKTGEVGTPAGTPREVVDNTYQYSLLTTFESSEDHDKYQIEPAHLQFIESCKHIWSRVLIYDSVSI